MQPVTCQVTIRNLKAERHAAEIGTTIYLGDFIKTADESATSIILADEALLQVAENSDFIIDDFVLSHASRDFKARVLTDAIHYLAKNNIFNKDKRTLFLANAKLSIRGTNFIAEVDQRIRITLLDGEVKISARSNDITLYRRGHTVFLDRTGRFDEAFILPDADIEGLAKELGLEVELPPRPKTMPLILLNPIRCAFLGGTLICG